MPLNFARILSVLVLASSVSIMSTDIYAPSLPYLATFFGAAPSLVQLTISLNVLMFGCGQLVLGPLSDRFGRKPILLSAILLFSISSFFCALAHSIEQLIIARMLQGFMGAAEAVICLAIFKDLFDEKQQVRALAIFGMSVALAPAVAPIIGGYVHVWLGWQFNFHLIGVLGVVTSVLIYWLLPESAPPNRQALKLADVLGDYRALLCRKQFMAYAGLVGVGMGILYSFITAAPFILIEKMAILPQHFGYYSLSIVAAYFVGSLLAIRISAHYATDKLLNLGVVLLLIGGAAFILLAVLGWLTLFWFIGCFAVMTFALGPLFAVAPAKAMLATDRRAGSAAAMLGASEMLIGGLAAAVVSVLPVATVWPLAITLGGLMLITLGLMWLVKTGHRPDLH